MKENATSNENEIIFDTSHKYAFISGWLIIPAIATVLTFLGSIIMATFRNPSTLEGFDLFIYWTDVFFIPYLLIVFYTWVKRKRILPFLMILYFVIQAIWNFTYFANGYSIDFFNLGVSIIWIVYFIISKRVKATFVL